MTTLLLLRALLPLYGLRLARAGRGEVDGRVGAVVLARGGIERAGCGLLRDKISAHIDSYCHQS